jgi:phenylacetate-CoA ligase
LLLRCEGLAPHYQIELSRQHRLDVMRLFVEARPDRADGASRAAQAAALTAHIRNNIGVGVEVVVGDPGAVERSAGKARRLIDKRTKD